MKILTGDEVRSAISMLEVIDAVAEGFTALSQGHATIPVRTVMPTENGLMLYMPAYIHGAPVSVVKIVSVVQSNRQRGLPVIIASVQVSDAQTGKALALMDGSVLTALRTGAASGLATKLMARPDSRILAVIGSGVQARTQIEAVCTVRDITEIRIYSPHNAQNLATSLGGQYPCTIKTTSTAQEALRGADVIVAATNSKTPVVNGGDVSPGGHINGVGSFTPEMEEIAAALIPQMRVIVDHRESTWVEAGELIKARDQGLIDEDFIAGEIGDVAAGLVPGRTSAEEITFFKSVGNAVQDAVVAQRILEVANRRGLGVEVKL